MSKWLWALLLTGSVWVGACAEDSEPTYYVNFSASEEQRAAIADSFEQWREATGTAPTESNNPDSARIVFLEHPLPDQKYGQANYTVESFYDSEILQTVRALSRGVVVIDPAVWTLPRTSVLMFFNHEIGHIMTGSPHSRKCPSTMNTDFSNCGLTVIDDTATAQAIDRNQQGWWRRYSTNSL